MDILAYVAQRTGIPQSQVFSVASFYALFNLDPRGDHIVAICRGTACHTRGSRPLLERVKLQLGLRDTESEGGNADKVSLTTPVLRFTPAIPEEVEAAEHEGAKLAYLVEEGDLVPGTRWPACASTSRCRPARTRARST